VTHTEASVRARIFVEQAYAAELDNLAKEFTQKVDAARNQMAARGLVLSGPMTAKIAEINGEMITALTAKRLALWLESSDMYGVPITDEDAREILVDVLTLRMNQIENAALTGASVGGQALPAGSGPIYRSLLEQHVTINEASIQTEIERHRFAPQKTATGPTHVTHHNEVHIHGNTIGNLNLGDQIGTINTALQQISEASPEMVEALKQLTEAVAESKALSDESKRESIEAIAELL